jgi:Zn-dependent M28 family amino/carboxypeptidase
MRRRLLVAAFIGTAHPVLAQTTESLTKAAAETIIADDVARHIGAIADDSMMGRDTPSPEIEKTAQYVAEQFKKFGLKPGGDNGTWFQRYPLRKDSTKTAPNTVGILEGSDPKLKEEYIVFVAHMDAKGIESGETPDSIRNGADDNASGTAGVIELAEAFSQPGARPRRSLIFLTVSGEEKGLWGSRHFVDQPPVSIKKIVTALNFDMIGRFQDSVLVGASGAGDGALIKRMVAAHPELQLPVRAGETTFPPGRPAGSDYGSFANKQIPFIHFNTGTHPDYHRVTDSPEKIDTDAEARILRLAFYVAQEAANADQRPKPRQ